MRFRIWETHTPVDTEFDRERDSAYFETDAADLEAVRAGLIALNWTGNSLVAIMADIEAGTDADDLAGLGNEGVVVSAETGCGDYEWIIAPSPDIKSPDSKEITLSRPEKLYLERLADTVDTQGDQLYKSLKFVGDDDVKAVIQAVLRQVLSPHAYRTVVATFLIATDWENCHSKALQQAASSLNT